MSLELYDEITRNGFDLHDIIVEKYTDKLLTFENLVDEIKGLNKVIFIPHHITESMQIDQENINKVLNAKKMKFAQLAGFKGNNRSLLGIVIGQTKTEVQEAVSLYTISFTESVGKTRH